MGINQTVMAALSFVVIAALIGAPGLGKPVIDALIIRNVGDGFVAGIAVVLIAIMLDRSTSAAITKKETFVPPSGSGSKAQKTCSHNCWHHSDRWHCVIASNGLGGILPKAN